MPITADERFNGRRRTGGNKPSMSVDYIVRRGAGDPDYEDFSDLLDQLNDTAPTSIYDDISGLDITTTAYSITEQLGQNLFIGQVQYGSDQVNQKDGQYAYTFETTGGTKKILQSLQTWSRQNADGTTAPDLHGAIGVTDGKIEGVDITVPIFQFSETWTLRTLTPGYANAIFSITGTVNAVSFRDLPSGEALFLGASGSKRGRGDWEITFKWACSPSVTNLMLSGFANPVPLKKGWEYLWLDYEKQVVGTGATSKTRLIPVAAYVDQVYQLGDFSVLGIGS